MGPREGAPWHLGNPKLRRFHWKGCWGSSEKREASEFPMKSAPNTSVCCSDEKSETLESPQGFSEGGPRTALGLGGQGCLVSLCPGSWEAGVYPAHQLVTVRYDKTGKCLLLMISLQLVSLSKVKLLPFGSG